MDLRLRFVASHPRAGAGGPAQATDFALSARRPGVAIARGGLLVEQATSTLSVRALRRAPAAVERIVYCGAARVYLAFLDDRSVAAYRDGVGSAAGIELAAVAPQSGDSDRPCTMASASRSRSFAVFSKAESSNVHCVTVAASVDGKGAVRLSVFKLHADFRGVQENVNALDKGLMKLRGKVAGNVKTRSCPIVAVAAHPDSDLAAAAYENGILRVWDVAGKQLYSVFDAQLLLNEKVVDIDFHPGFPYVVACTSLGRIMSFAVRSRPITKGEEPQLASYKLRDRTRRYRAMCVMEGEPSVLLLLTISRRIIVRLVNDRGQILASTRFPKSSRRLPLEIDDSSVSAGPLDPDARVSLECEPTFGLIAASFDDTSGDVFIYERHVDGVSGVRRAIVGSPIDTGFSRAVGKSFKGPVEVFSEGMFAQNGKLYSYGVQSTEVSELCRLPPSSEVRRIEVARDQFGSLFAALIFLYADGESDAGAMYDVEECPSQYVIATKRGEGEAWNVSEASDGATGCFLGASGKHDRVLTLSLDGKSAAIRSFAGQRLSAEQKRNPQVARGNTRGVQKFKVSESGILQVFRAPFAGWTGVVYVDAVRKCLFASRNSFRSSMSTGYPHAMDGAGLDDGYEVDEESEMPLTPTEHVLDIRWQWLPTGGRVGDQFLAAIMTNERIYIVRDAFDPVCIFEYSTISRSVVSFTLPTMCWMGPSVMAMFGQYLYSVTLDGRGDLVAGMSQSDNAATLLAALPDRIVFCRPPTKANVPVSVVSRPIGMVSVLVRGMLALPSARGKSGSHFIEKLQGILTLQDTSQGSEALIDALIGSDLSPIAYILVTSESGQHNLPALKRASFLGKIGDLRGALAVAEAEYSRLPTADAFHSGTELFRILQRILNMAMASGEFAVGQRCSELLGRKGTFSSFIEGEGGYAAVTSLAKHAKRIGNTEMAETLGVLVAKSAKSCVATDVSGMPSIEQQRNTRAGIEAFDGSDVALGTEDRAEIYTVVAPEDDEDGGLGQAQKVRVAGLEVDSVMGRLETGVCEDVRVLKDEMEMAEFDGHAVSQEGWLHNAVATDGRPLSEGSALFEGQGKLADPQGAVPKRDWAAFRDVPELAEELMAPAAVDVREAAAQHAARQQAKVREMRQHTRAVVARSAAEVQGVAQRDRLALAVRTAQDGVALQQAAGHRADGVAARCLAGAFEKMAERRYESALKEVVRGLGAVAKQHARDGGAGAGGGPEGGPVLAAQVAELVHYRVALQLLVALESVTGGEAAGTAGGRTTAAQLATAVASLPLRPAHRAAALMQAANAHMAIDNYGYAAAALRGLGELGAGRGGGAGGAAVRAGLAAKYAACTARGGANRAPHLATRFCCESLRVIVPGVPQLKCTFCPAFFSAPALAELHVSAAARCPCCGIGGLVPLG